MSAVAPGRARGVATVGDALAAATDALAAVGVPGPRLDAEVLLAEASGRERASLIADPGAVLAPAESRRYGEFVRRRLRREPVAYIVGHKGFRRIDLAVDRRVLVPRPETELLVEVALERRPRRVLDVGTGSGAIALAIADELPEAEIVATDTSAGALEVARANAARLGLADRVRFEQGTLPAAMRGRPLARTAGQRTTAPAEFDLVLANLPYVAERDWAGLAPEVTHWEPREALLAGPDGLDAYRALLIPECVRTSDRYPTITANAQAVAVEIGQGQAAEVAELVRGAGFPRVEVREDLAGTPRVVVGER